MAKKGLLQTYLTLHDQVIEANSEKRQMQMAVHFVPLQAENDFGHLKVVEESHVFADLAKDVYLFETPAEFERLEKNCARFFAEFAPIMNQAVENYCKEHHDHEKTNSDDCNFQKKQSVSA
ncbi:hypothetical protein [Enterococcus timonensis]|uniref:hypothetical protein n=1 Tax=Enterococcus timonensis TaxID=1852364 RepID=UPI00131A1100|nr:hypothetical protein [Enterococcus timonensis]